MDFNLTSLTISLISVSRVNIFFIISYLLLFFIFVFLFFVNPVNHSQKMIFFEEMEQSLITTGSFSQMIHSKFSLFHIIVSTIFFVTVISLIILPSEALFFIIKFFPHKYI